jgi:hypothetical protein
VLLPTVLFLVLLRLLLLLLLSAGMALPCSTAPTCQTPTLLICSTTASGVAKLLNRFITLAKHLSYTLKSHIQLLTFQTSHLNVTDGDIQVNIYWQLLQRHLLQQPKV